jgi:cytochrome c biogenesis protein CcdA
VGVSCSGSGVSPRRLEFIPAGRPTVRRQCSGPIAGVELLSALPYLAAIALIVGSDVSDVQKVILLLLYNVVYALPLIAIAAVTAFAEPKAQRLLTPVTAWLMRHWPTLVASLSVTVGIALVAYGGARLTIL